jgi:hypothetical protein
MGGGVALGSGDRQAHHGDRPAVAVVASSTPPMVAGGAALAWGSRSVLGCYARCMTVRDMLTALQALPRDAELLAFEAGCEDYCEREVDEVEWQGGRVYLHLGARRDDPPRG